MVMSYKKILDKTLWSFSTLRLYEQCPYAFYCKKIENREAEQNFFAENGSVMHGIFEELLNGKYSLAEAPAVYQNRFELICNKTRLSTMDKTFEKCMDYLCSAKAFDVERYELLGVEQKLNFKIGKYAFIGVADCIIRDKEKGMVILVDHKSNDHFMKKDGLLLKSQQGHFLTYKKQMYLYCKGLQDCLGLHVDKIVWHHFKDKGELTVIPFCQHDYEETLDWAVDTIKRIYSDRSFQNRMSYMLCGQLCGYRGDCEYRKDN